MSFKHLLVCFGMGVLPIVALASGCDCGGDPKKKADGGAIDAGTGGGDTGRRDGGGVVVGDGDVVVPDGALPDGATRPDGQQPLPDGQLPDAGPRFSCHQVAPEVISSRVDTTLTLTGALFMTGATVELHD